MVSSKAQRVFKLVQAIPKGKVTTYGELARAARLHPRAIGSILRSNKQLGSVPCYRVVRSDGAIGGYVLGLKAKKVKLRKAGVRFKVNGKVDLPNCLSKFNTK